MSHWLQTPPGRYLLAWEQHHLDLAVADLFGFHALQLGLPELDALRANRMPHRWVATEAAEAAAVSGALPRAAVARGRQRQGFGDHERVAGDPAVRHAVGAQRVELWQPELQGMDAEQVDNRGIELALLPLQQVAAWRGRQPEPQLYN